MERADGRVGQPGQRPGELEGEIDLEIARLVESRAADVEIAEVADADPAQRRHGDACLDEDRPLVDGDAERADQKRCIEGGVATDGDRADELRILDVEVAAGDVDPEPELQMERCLQMERRRHREACEARQVEADVLEQIEAHVLIAAHRGDWQVDDEVTEPATRGPRHARHARDRAGIGERGIPDGFADRRGLLGQLVGDRVGGRIPEIRHLAGNERQGESGLDRALEPLSPLCKTHQAIGDLRLIRIGGNMTAGRYRRIDSCHVGRAHRHAGAARELWIHQGPALAIVLEPEDVSDLVLDDTHQIDFAGSRAAGAGQSGPGGPHQAELLVRLGRGIDEPAVAGGNRVDRDLVAAGIG